MLFICYPKCSTCAKARSFLNNNNIELIERDITKDNPTKEELKKWIKISGLPIKRFFNTSGLVYRSLNLKDKLSDMSDDEMIELLSSDGMLVKRPLLILDDLVLVGFKQSEWEKQLIG